MFAAIDRQCRHIAAPGHAVLTNIEIALLLAGGGDGEHRSDRRCVIDVAAKFGRQVQHLPQPVATSFLQFGRRRPGAPEHRIDVECGCERFCQNPGRRAGDCEIRHETRMVPVRDVRLDQALEIREERVGGFAVQRRSGGNAAANVAGRDARHDRVFVGVIEIVGGEIGDPVHRGAKLRDRPIDFAGGIGASILFGHKGAPGKYWPFQIAFSSS